MKSDLKWFDAGSGLVEAKPKTGVCYFVGSHNNPVEWFAGISTGTSYKRVHTIFEGGTEQQQAKDACQNHWSTL